MNVYYFDIFILLDKVFLILKNSNDAKVNFWLHEIVKKKLIKNKQTVVVDSPVPNKLNSLPTCIQIDLLLNNKKQCHFSFHLKHKPLTSSKFKITSMDRYRIKNINLIDIKLKSENIHFSRIIFDILLTDGL